MRHFLLPVWILCAGCAAHRIPAWSVAPTARAENTAQSSVDAEVEAGTRAFSARADRTQLDIALVHFRAAVAARPDDPRLRVLAARAAMAAGALREGPRGAALLAEAIENAEQALARRNSELRRLALAHAPSDATMGATERVDLPALTIYFEALFAWAERRGLATLLGEQDWIRAAAQRATFLDRSVGYGTPDRVLGMLEATVPPTAGGNLPDALERFELAIATAPDYLPTRLEYAQRYAVRVRDALLYQRLLEEVAHGDARRLSDAAAENLAAQAEARQILAERLRH